jgi:hypothetical protein
MKERKWMKKERKRTAVFSHNQSRKKKEEERINIMALRAMVVL